MKQMTNDELLQEWASIKIALEDIKIKELNLRNEITNRYFPHDDGDMLSGVKCESIGNGFKLKASFKINYSIDNDSEKISAVTRQLRTFGYNWEKIINFKPTLVVSEYNKVNDSIKRAIDQIITAKPGQPTLEIVAEKS